MILLALRLLLMAWVVVLFVFWAGSQIGGPWCHPDIVGCVGLVTYDDVYDTVVATLPR